MPQQLSSAPYSMEGGVCIFAKTKSVSALDGSDILYSRTTHSNEAHVPFKSKKATVSDYLGYIRRKKTFSLGTQPLIGPTVSGIAT